MMHTNCKIIFGSGHVSKDRYNIVIIEDAD
jgi:hypothetical protein